jgi:hypothetical protein
MSDTSQSLGHRDVSPAQLVDLARYPTTGTDAPDFRSPATGCRDQLDATGCCILPDLLTKDALTLALDDERYDAVARVLRGVS